MGGCKVREDTQWNTSGSYIVFDLEWNQSPKGKRGENPKIPFEIIEIGAVKLNRDREITDKFHRLVRPMIYKKIHFRTKEIIGVDMKALENGDFFYQVIKEFLQWCGEDPMFCTWGAMDLTELQRNMKYYGQLNLLKGPLRYYDVQKLFSIAYEDGKSRKGLEYAIDFLQLEKTRDFHRALSDAYYTANILALIEERIATHNYSIDCYQNPQSKEEELYARFDRYSKYVSREFDSKEEAMKDKEIVSTRCAECNKNARKKTRWFSINSKNYYSVALCNRHGYLKGKIRMKKTDEGKFYVVKTVKLTDEAEAESIKIKKDDIRKKRKMRKQGGGG